MNNYKPSNKPIIFYFTSLFLLANDSYAVDMGVLQEQCAEIGFKIKTPANGKCVLRLMKSVANQQTAQAAPKTPAISSTTNNSNMDCQIDSDCNAGFSCRSKKGGGTECITKVDRYIQQTTQIAIQQRPIQQQPAQQQNETGVGTTILQGLVGVVQLLGAAAQGYSQGRQQSAPVPSYQPTTTNYYQPTTTRCNSAYSSLSKSVDTTCRQY